MNTRDLIVVCIKKGEPWRKEYNKTLERWGGWQRKVDVDTVIKQGEYFPDTATDSDYTSWIWDDYGDTATGALSRDLWFLIPQALHDELFGPKFNEYGEIAP